MNGSPLKLVGQLQIGLWFTTWQIALIPQVPTQGFLHFWLIHASFGLQSVLVIHSGLHVGGLPKKPGRQVQTAWPLISRHWLFGPQGVGLQGLVITGSIYKKRYWKIFEENTFVNLQLNKDQIYAYL